MKEKTLLLDAISSGDVDAEQVLHFCFARMDPDDLVDLCEHFNLYEYDDGVLLDEL